MELLHPNLRGVASLRYSLTAGLIENSIYGFAAEIEDGAELAFDPEGVGEVADRAERKCVGYVVMHEHAVVFGFEAVFVIPEAIGADALFIDKAHARFDVADFRQPVDPDQRRDANAVGDHLPGMHRAGFADGAELHLGWSQSVEIGRS